MKNENEYRIEDRLYIRKIRKCVCRERNDGAYLLSCKVHQRGEKEYSYTPGDGYLGRGSKKLWLSDNPEENGKNAMETVADAVDIFEQQVSCFVKEEKQEVVIEHKLFLSYRRKSYDIFDVLLDFRNGEKSSSCILIQDRDIEWMVKNIVWEAYSNGFREETAVKILDHSSEETIDSNPLYRNALEKEDELLAKQLKLYYNLATVKECAWIETRLGRKILPKLSEAFDRNFIVAVDDSMPALLQDSGYTIWHRPYFAMMGYTHINWQINPHTKQGVDAARKDTEAITFSDFLELFRDGSRTC